MKIGVIGAGAWGTALAQAMAAASHNVVLWGRGEAQMASMAEASENTQRLPGVTLSSHIEPTAQFADLAGCDAYLLVTPAQTTAEMAALLAPLLTKPTPVLLCAKGISRETLTFPDAALKVHAPKAIPCVLSGPSFAHDVGRGLPTAVTLAAADGTLAEDLAEQLSSPAFRLYHSDDVIGAQVGGAVKNVLAIACGIVAGRKLGASAHAALTTRGFAEMSRLGLALGAKQETLNGLSGLGDLILTCSSPQSRNMSLGLAIGQSPSVKEALASFAKLSEGALTAPALVKLAVDHKVDMPISSAVAAILANQLTVDQAIEALLKRPLKKDGA